MRMIVISRIRAASVALAALALVASCASTSTDGGSGSAARHTSSRVTVVASTDVWGDVVRQIAGPLADTDVHISSIIRDPDADPHSYEASPQNQLALSKADIVLQNGGGYDDFVSTMLKAAGNPSALVLNAVQISGKGDSAGDELNEHVWYDFPTVQKVADRISEALSTVNPDAASTFAENTRAFDHELAGLEATEAAIKAAHAGEGVAITEPVPLYLLQACGLVNKTPAAFSHAIEDGTGVSALVLHQTEDLFNRHAVSLLAYNAQTSGPETEAVLRAARDDHVTVVPVTETLPAGQDYLSWMRANLAAVRAGLG